MKFNNLREKFWELPLNELSDIEWEALSLDQISSMVDELLIAHKNWIPEFN